MFSLQLGCFQWPFSEPKLEVPTIYSDPEIPIDVWSIFLSQKSTAASHLAIFPIVRQVASLSLLRSGQTGTIVTGEKKGKRPNQWLNLG